MGTLLKWTGFAGVAFGVAVFPFAVWFPGPWGTLSLLLVMFGCVFLLTARFVDRLAGLKSADSGEDETGKP